MLNAQGPIPIKLGPLGGWFSGPVGANPLLYIADMRNGHQRGRKSTDKGRGARADGALEGAVEGVDRRA